MKVQLTNVRIAFAQLFEAKQVNGEGEPRHSAVFIIDPKSANARALDEAMSAVAAEKWKDKGKSVLADLSSKGRVCFLKSAKTNQSGEVYDGFEGMFSVTAGNKARPLTLDRNKSPLTQADGRPYSGCYVNALIELWAQDNNWGRRVNATLKGVQFVGDGDAFGGGTPANPDDFADLGVPAESEAALV
jgi:hypothetical protein